MVKDYLLKIAIINEFKLLSYFNHIFVKNQVQKFLACGYKNTATLYKKGAVFRL